MGFAYHGNYLAWLEMARVELLDALGVPYRELEAAGYFLPVVEANVRYRKPARFDDRLIVRAQIKEPARLRIRLDYSIHRGEEVISTAFTQHAFIDREDTLIRPPERFLQAVEAAVAAGGASASR